ncbi:MAG: hypothetical protein AAF483_13425, partial [Planctomycetota bacterium]
MASYQSSTFGRIAKRLHSFATLASCVAFLQLSVLADEPKTLFEFGNDKQIARLITTHPASIKNTDDAAIEGSASAKTMVDNAAEAKGYFGVGVPFSELNLSESVELRLWVKSDAESDFNLQVHSGDKQASAFGFSTFGSAGKWIQVTAPLASFVPPAWSAGKVDWTAVSKVQITAFGNGPYDGKYIMLGGLV